MHFNFSSHIKIVYTTTVVLIINICFMSFSMVILIVTIVVESGQQVQTQMIQRKLSTIAKSPF